MPFKNEHAARQASPGKFDKYRRQNDAGGKGIDFIYGIKGGKSEIQTIRFDAGKFTTAQAKAWLTEHKFKTSVEPAKGDHAESAPVSATGLAVPVALNNARDITTGKEIYSPDSIPRTEPQKSFAEGPWSIYLGTLPNGYEVYAVDGAYVRDHLAVDYTGGDHDEVWMPRNTCYVEKQPFPYDGAMNCMHECVEVLAEYPVDSDGDYDASHQNTNYIEHICRNMYLVCIGQPPSVDEVATASDHASGQTHKEIVMDNTLNMIDEDDDDYEDDELEVEAFASGTHTDMTGKTESWTDADLVKIADKYNSMANEAPAPVVIGHPTDASPAYGWIKSARAFGNKLILRLGELNRDFVSALKDGAYKTRSLSMYDDGTIRHLGFLGGMQPAVKGLAPFKFASSENSHTYNFEERTVIMATPDTEVMEVKRENAFFKKIFAMFKVEVPTPEQVKSFSEPKVAPEPEKKADPAPEKKVEEPKKEFADASQSVVDKENGPSGTSAADPAQAQTDREAKEGTVPPAEQTVDKAAIAKTKDEANVMAEENSRLKAEIEALKSQLEALKKSTEKQAQETGNRAFCENLVKAGKLRPAELDAEIENLNMRDYTDSCRSFAEGDGQVPAAETYRKHLSTRPKIVEFGEMVAPPDLPAKDALVGVPSIDAFVEKGIKDKMQLNPAISYEDALKQTYAEAQSKFDAAAWCEYNKQYMR